ncbi:WD40-repeat-containing domain protein [Mucidula mucida]|nr:WD40-repeat-containing domain protein [Mucidula mucida]
MPPKPDDEEVAPPQRPPSPPIYTTFGVRGVHVPNFSAFNPRDYRFTGPHRMNHVAWNCDGKRLAAVGIDKVTRIWNPDKSMDVHKSQSFTGGHSEAVDYISWNPTHPDLFVTSSSTERKLVFWDARQSRNIQQVALKSYPMQTNYSPDGRTVLYNTSGHQLYFVEYGPGKDSVKESWATRDTPQMVASTAMFNHAGDGLVLTHHAEHQIRVVDYPSMSVNETTALAAHVGGCVAVALDPRGRYLASGGHDSIVNMFDLTDWICARTITSCEYEIKALSFSFDGEYLAIASSGNYVDICATETSEPLHRVPSPASAQTVAWHPNRYVIAYCGQTKHIEPTPTTPAVQSVPVVSLFGLLE